MKVFVRSTAIIIILFFFFTLPANAFDHDIKNSRLIPSDTVTVVQDGKIIAEYTYEMPVPEGVLLSCQSECALKLEDIIIVGEDQSQFSILSKDNEWFLNVKNGTVHYGILSGSKSLVFMTPKGAVSSKQVIITASNRNLLEGYVKVESDSSEVGVVDGGSMLLATKDGLQMIKSGESFILAQADIGTGTPGVEDPDNNNEENFSWWQNLSTAGKIGVSAAGASAVAGSAYFIKERRDDRDASPSLPE